MKIAPAQQINSSVHHDTAILFPKPNFAQIERCAECCWKVIVKYYFKRYEVWLTSRIHIQKSEAGGARASAGSAATPELAEQGWASTHCFPSCSSAKWQGHLPAAACQMCVTANYNQFKYSRVKRSREPIITQKYYKARPYFTYMKGRFLSLDSSVSRIPLISMYKIQ